MHLALAVVGKLQVRVHWSYRSSTVTQYVLLDGDAHAHLRRILPYEEETPPRLVEYNMVDPPPEVSLC